jgi:hypothetical protein
MRSYLEVPLRIEGGAVIGSYCVVHTEPRDFSHLDIETLAEIGACIVDHLDLLRIKQEHARAQHLISGLGAIVAGSLDLPIPIDSPSPSIQNSPERPRLGTSTPDKVISAIPDSITPSEVANGDVETKSEKKLIPADAEDLQHDLEDFRLDDCAKATIPLPSKTSPLSPSGASQSGPESAPLPSNEPEPRRGRLHGNNDESMFADITQSIYSNTDVDGVLILDAQVADMFAESQYSHPSQRQYSSFGALDAAHRGNRAGETSFCKEVGISIRPSKEPTAMKLQQRLASSVLHELLSQYPAGVIFRREKDAPRLDQRMYDQEREGEQKHIATGTLDARESLFEYLYVGC